MARPARLNPDRAQRIAELVAAGNNVDTAAAAGGISEAAFYSWMARGRKERDRLAGSSRAKPKASEAIYVEFLETIEKARAEAEARLVLLIHKAAQEPRTWQAAAWLLERRDPGKWGRPWRPQPAQAAEGKGALEKAVSSMTDRDPLPGE